MENSCKEICHGFAASSSLIILPYFALEKLFVFPIDYTKHK